MADFLKAHPFITLEDYMWKINPCLMRLMVSDNTRVHYLTEKQAKRRKAVKIDGTNLTSDLGLPIL